MTNKQLKYMEDPTTGKFNKAPMMVGLFDDYPHYYWEADAVSLISTKPAVVSDIKTPIISTKPISTVKTPLVTTTVKPPSTIKTPSIVSVTKPTVVTPSDVETGNISQTGTESGKSPSTDESVFGTVGSGGSGGGDTTVVEETDKSAAVVEESRNKLKKILIFTGLGLFTVFVIYKIVKSKEIK